MPLPPADAGDGDDASLPLVAHSASMREALADFDRCARVFGWPVFIEGETGAGKTLFALRLHHIRRGADRPFQHIMLNTIPASLVSSELFGHAPGAFTDARSGRAGLIASAAGGTVFLDEIDKPSLDVLGHLLRVIDRREYFVLGTDKVIKIDVEFVAASNRSPAQLVREGKFPPDLLARFGHFFVRVPSLRERRADIPDLAEWFVRQLAPRCGYECPPEIEPDLLALLCAADWPGNLRELESALALVMSEARGARVLTPGHLCSRLVSELGAGTRGKPSDEQLLDAYAVAHGNVPRTSEMLGISRTTAWRRLRDLGKTRASGTLRT